MPSSTDNYGLILYDRITDSGKLFIDMRDDLIGTTVSNAIKTDTALKSQYDNMVYINNKTISHFETITGDGINKDFLITHNLNTLTPVVDLYDINTGDQHYTKTTSLTTNQIQVSFFNAPIVGESYEIIVSFSAIFKRTTGDSITNKTIATIGNGTSTSFVLHHTFNSRDLNVSIRRTYPPYSEVVTTVEFTTLDSITISFSTAPTTNQYTVTILG